MAEPKHIVIVKAIVLQINLISSLYNALIKSIDRNKMD